MASRWPRFRRHGAASTALACLSAWACQQPRPAARNHVRPAVSEVTPPLTIQRLGPGGCALSDAGIWLCPSADATPDNGCPVEQRAPQEPPPAVGDGLRCSLREGIVACRGNNPEGGLGDGHTRKSNDPVRVRLLGRAAQLAVGSQHACALLGDGSVWCWGENSRGAVGVGELPACCDIPDPARPSEYLMPQRVVNLPASVAVVARGQASCALTHRGDVYCWGENGSGELGIPPTGQPLARPTRLLNMPAIKQLVMDLPSCALGVDGQAYCWGDACPLRKQSTLPLKVDWAELARRKSPG